MSQKERNEWIERAKQRVLNNAEITDQSVKEIMFLFDEDRKSTRLNSSHGEQSRMPSSA